VSLKLSSLYCRLDAIDPENSFEGVARRLRPILRAAMQHDASVNVDMEHCEVKDLTLDIFKRVLMEDEFRAWPHASITIQTYLPENREDLRSLVEWAGRRGTPVHLRLVKGAYWDREVQHAAYRDWPIPVHQSKDRTDADFEDATAFVLSHHDILRVAIAGHNVRSVAHAMAVAESLGLPRDAVEYQTLLGLGDEINRALAARGCRVRVYVPFGGLVPGMAYLVRRLLEATSRSAFLHQMWASPLPMERLLKPPGLPQAEPKQPAVPAGSEAAFRNEPVSDFSRREAREAMQRAIDNARSEPVRAWPLWINGKAVSTEDELLPKNPGRMQEIIGRVASASRRDAARAVRAALKARPAWSATSPHDRAALLLRAASAMRQRRFELAAWEIFEEAKDWREADADVAEAIDYLEYYAREAVRLAQPRRRDLLGESNEYFHEPRGLAVAITP